MIKKTILLFCFFLVFNISYSYEYRLPEENEYYINVNTDRNIGGNDYEKVKRQVNSQYKGKLENKNTRPKFNLFEYGYYLNLGFSAGMTNNDTLINSVIGTDFKTDYRKTLNGIVGLGIFWYNGFRWELEYSEDNKRDKDNFPEKTKIAKYDMNFIFENYMYNTNLTPYIGIGGGMIQGNMNGHYSYKPMAQALIGISYKIEEHTSFYVNYKYARALSDLNVNHYKFGYSNNSIDFGFRIFIF